MTRQEARDRYREWVPGKLRRLKNPMGGGTAGLVGKVPQKKFDAGVLELEQWLGELRKEGVVAFTNGRWWVR